MLLNNQLSFKKKYTAENELHYKCYSGFELFSEGSCIPENEFMIQEYTEGEVYISIGQGLQKLTARQEPPTVQVVELIEAV